MEDIIQCIFLARIKYQVGFYPVTGVTNALRGQPVQHFFWSKAQKGWIEPIDVCHWEEVSVERSLSSLPALTLSSSSSQVYYWLFLLNLKPTSPGWFRSPWFKATIGTAVACPILFATLQGYFHYVYVSSELFRSSVYMTEAVVTMAFTLSIMVQNALFSFWIIPRFPKFLRHLEGNGASPDLLKRFATFDTLNRIRVAARWCFGVPLFVLAADNLWGQVKLNQIPWVVDLCIIGCYPGFAASAALTLVIFLPVRSPYDNLAFSSSSSSAANGTLQLDTSVDPSSSTDPSSPASPYRPFAPTPPLIASPSGLLHRRLHTFPATPDSPPVALLTFPPTPTSPAARARTSVLHSDPFLSSPAGDTNDTKLATSSALDALPHPTAPLPPPPPPAPPSTATTSVSDRRLPHPFVTATRRPSSGALNALGGGSAVGGGGSNRQAGYARTEESWAGRLHPEILGFSSPIDIVSWTLDVQASTSATGTQDETAVVIEMLPEEGEEEDEESAVKHRRIRPLEGLGIRMQ
ncbi:hypothetical protein JCM6882_005565 [Rhodosporidiobolus microsporus]